ncbi:MAG: pilus assembly protein [Elusimicrobia bacterium]|nr:pilus assembly protein [Elusimicrobiota bacterium]
MNRLLAGERARTSSRADSGQAMTETVLLLPMFVFFLYAFAKIFAALVLIQKMEIASYYAARRWQLESHRNYAYAPDDEGTLKPHIKRTVANYLGYGTPIGRFLDLDGAEPELTIERTQVWQVVYLRVKTKPVMVSWMYKSKGFDFEITKYVPNRDRPIAFELPGMH